VSGSSSTSTSEAGVQPLRRLIGRLALFLTPYAVVSACGGVLLAHTGELIPVRAVAAMQSLGHPFIFLPKLSDHMFALKVAAARRIRPEVLAIGSSRGNQWRSAMFAPNRFYNAANAAYRLPDYRRMFDAIGRPAPRVVIFSIDFFLFLSDWNRAYDYVSYDDLQWGSPEVLKIAQSLAGLIKEDPWFLLRPRQDPIYGVPAFGISAWQSGTGTRIDGSLQYGGIIRGDPLWAGGTLETTVLRVANGTAPFQFGEHMAESGWSELTAFVRAAHAAGTVLIGIAMPFSPEVVEALNRSARHQHWHQFQAPATAERFRRLGITYFDFSDLAAFGGRPEEFVDPFHPSEPAYIRMWRVMLREPEVRRTLPGIDESALEWTLEHATRLEAFRNRF
jgi:hypothetical protein